MAVTTSVPPVVDHPVAQSRPASIWEWALAALLGVNLAWTGLCLGGYPAEARLVTSGLTAALLATWAVARSLDSQLASRRLHPAGWLPVPFLVYAALNGNWVSPVRWLAWVDWLGWLQAGAVYWVVLNGVGSRGPRRMVFFVLVGLALTGVILGCYQVFVRPEWAMWGRDRPPEFRARASGSFAIPNSFAGLLLLLLPVTGTLAVARGRSVTTRVWWLWVTAVLFLGLALTVSRGAWLAAAAAGVAWPLLGWEGGRRWRRSLLMTLLAGAVVTVALFAAYRHVPGAKERMLELVSTGGERSRPILWAAGWKLFRESPWLGTGGGSYNLGFERYRPEQFADIPLYAHNDYLNTLSDYGLLGGLLWLGAMGVAAYRLWAAERRDAARSDFGLAGPAAVGLGAFGLHLLLEFHLKIPALALAAAVVAAFVLRAAWPAGAHASTPGVPRHWRLWRAWGVAAMVIGGWGAWVAPTYRAEALRFHARAELDTLAMPAASGGTPAAIVTRARSDLDRAVRLDPTHAAAWADLAFATGLAANVTPDLRLPLGKEAETQARRALELSSAPAESWIRLGTALSLQGDWAGASRAYLQATVVAPFNANAWYYYAEHLSRLFAVHEAADAALRVCLRLDPGNPAGLALRQRLALTKKAR